MAQKSRKPSLTHRVNSFPAAWSWFVDELIPTYVKRTYSPRESWKDKPFTTEDARFFFKGISELSELFTEERPTKLPEYFAHPKFRSAYLLYFLPLQAAKFLSVFQLHPEATQAALKHAAKTGTLHLADLGAGPGTASIAFLLWLLDQPLPDGRKELPTIELHWFDTNRAIMDDGAALIQALSDQFPKLRGKVQGHMHGEPWWKATPRLPRETSLIFFGNVLNEAALPQQASWSAILERAQGAGTLYIEPALKRSSQLLSQLRDELLEAGAIENSARSIWGPCLHAERCPLAAGRDWCHFSVPVEIPGRWFTSFSKGLGSERQWVKFSYLWLSSPEARAPVPSPRLRRVVSDPIQKDRNADVVLICEPERPGRIRVPSSRHVHRGDLITED
ncbi:MAG: small ribosomal subunit Rsm22 family protein [Oligoflexia bacterium]|nr:small ribosomal subunit Rsm22 family protein [Oligoflexia bacterium]